MGMLEVRLWVECGLGCTQGRGWWAGGWSGQADGVGQWFSSESMLPV